MDTSPSLVIPRLRLTRLSPQTRDTSPTPVAGPSHYSPEMNHHESEDEDMESTPRLSQSAIAPERSPRTSPTLPTDTPAGRLRALLARVPNTSATPRPSSSRLPAPVSPSEPDSDFDPPNGSSETPSVARESLRELFSRALREPGNTPQKGRPRRNSIDSSVVEATPRIERVEQERAKNKGKRRSMSDEEADHLSRTSDCSEPSFRSTSAAATFDALRERLGLSSTMPPTPPPEQMVLDMSMPLADSSEDTTTILRNLNRQPSNAIGSPTQILQMSGQGQSNLLEQDSEMQKALRGMDSYEGDSLPNGRPLSFPPARSNEFHSSPARPQSWSSHSKSHSTNNLPPVPPARRVSDDMSSSSSRASSSLSGADYNERHGESPRERVHEREQGWNHRVPPMPRSPGIAPHASRLSKKSSATSLRSTNDGRSSRASSVMSQLDYREREAEVEQERNKERERAWNQPRHSLSHSTSQLSLNGPEHTRTQPMRSDSAMSFTPPVRHTLHRHHSSNSLSNSSRAGSPASSISSRSVGKEHQLEVMHEAEHVLERNWTSSHPQRVPKVHTPHRTPSPMPHTPSVSPPASNLRRHNSAPKTPSHRLAPSVSAKPALVRGHSSETPGGKEQSVPGSLSPFIRGSTESRAPVPRSTSPPPAANGPKDHSGRASGTFKSRFGWSFPQNRTALPPLELDKDSPVKSALHRPSSALSNSSSSSHIPVRTPRKGDGISTSTPRTNTERKKGHRRSLTEFSEAVGAIPRIAEPPPDDDSDDAATEPTIDDISDAFGSDEEVPPATSTPPAKPGTLPSAFERRTTTPPSSPSSRKAVNGDAQRLLKALAKPPPRASSPPSAEPSSYLSALQTPPRRPHLTTSRLEFETPPPPKNMPDLPGPPSSPDSDGDGGEHTPVALEANATTMKTPRPPGAWADTPAPRRRTSDLFVRAQSTPPDVPASSVFATPSTKPRANTLPSNSLPPQTPAPPGAWMATPATARRKSILKVRFDVESEVASSDAGDHSPGKALNGPESVDRVDASGTPPSVRAEANASPSEPVWKTDAARPLTPPSTRKRAVRKSPRSPSIRVVDAFGRETPPEDTPESAEIDVEDKSVTKFPAGSSVADTPRKKSIVKVVDAMGRAVDDDVSADTPLSHNEALARVRQLTVHLAEDLSEVDKFSADLVVLDDQRRMNALEDTSRAARSARSKISRSIQLVKDAESDLRSKYGPLRASMRRSRFLPSSVIPRSVSWSLVTSWTFWFSLVAVQCAVWFIMHRMSVLRAKTMFLTTYYDPYYPDLYLHIHQTDTLHRSIPSASPYHVSDAIAPVGWSGFIADTWRHATQAIMNWPNQGHSADRHARGALAWPPT